MQRARVCGSSDDEGIFFSLFGKDLLFSLLLTIMITIMMFLLVAGVGAKETSGCYFRVSSQAVRFFLPRFLSITNFH